MSIDSSLEVSNHGPAVNMPFPCRRSFAYVQPYVQVALTAYDFAGISLAGIRCGPIVINNNKPDQAQLWKDSSVVAANQEPRGDGGQ